MVQIRPSISPHHSSYEKKNSISRDPLVLNVGGFCRKSDVHISHEKIKNNHHHPFLSYTHRHSYLEIFISALENSTALLSITNEAASCSSASDASSTGKDRFVAFLPDFCKLLVSSLFTSFCLLNFRVSGTWHNPRLKNYCFGVIIQVSKCWTSHN